MGNLIKKAFGVTAMILYDVAQKCSNTLNSL